MSLILGDHSRVFFGCLARFCLTEWVVSYKHKNLSVLLYAWSNEVRAVSQNSMTHLSSLTMSHPIIRTAGCLLRVPEASGKDIASAIKNHLRQWHYWLVGVTQSVPIDQKVCLLSLVCPYVER